MAPPAKLGPLLPGLVLSLAAVACAVGEGSSGLFDSGYDVGGSETGLTSTPLTTGADGADGASGSSGAADGSGDSAGDSTSAAATTDGTGASAGTSAETTGVVETCGNGVVDPGEDCDDANDDDTDACVAGCVAAMCGDGFVQTGVEDCDDANAVDTDACLVGCIASSCGDGIIQEGVEECDDANAIDTDDCVSGCLAASCGDGFVQAGVEQCDDSNGMDGDGCSSNCQFEAGVRTVFVTSQQFTGALGGLAGADAECQALADAAGLPGSYMAWLADGVESPATRFTQSPDPYVLPNGTVVADNWADLVDGTLDHAIDVTESGGVPPAGNTTCGGPTVWSNVSVNGAGLGASHCDNWTNAGATSAHWGTSNSATSTWTNWCSGGGAVCIWLSPIYCFQQ